MPKRFLCSILVIAGVVLLGTVARPRVVPYDPQTMVLATSLDVAKAKARDWACDPSLRLDLSGVQAVDSEGTTCHYYVLRAQDRHQVFEVDCTTGQVYSWSDSLKLEAHRSKLAGGTDRSLRLPIAELNAKVSSFLSARYPNYSSLNLHITRPDEPDSLYCQRLTNSVWYDGNYARCEIDEWTGEIVSYVAESSSPPTVSTGYTVTASSAEQAAQSYATTNGLGDLDDGSPDIPRAALIYKNWGVWVVPGSPERLAYEIEIIACDDTNATLQAYQTELAQSGRLASNWLVYVDANTGVAFRSESMVENEYYEPSVSAPSFAPAAGTYVGPQAVAISGLSGCTIRYTLDGTDPTPTSTQYAGQPIAVRQSLTLKARAYKKGYRSSVVTEAAYVIQ